MSAAITLTAGDIDAIATGLGLTLCGVKLHGPEHLASRLAYAAMTQPGSPAAQMLLRLLAESIRADMADPEIAP